MTAPESECPICGHPGLRPAGHAPWCARTKAWLRALHAPLPCGTPAAARRHWDRGEPLCEPCRDARNADKRQRYAAKKGAA